MSINAETIGSHQSDQSTNSAVMQRQCIINSLFQAPWPPDIGAHVLRAQHKIDFQHSAFLLQMHTIPLQIVTIENVQNLEKWMSYMHFPFVMFTT
jgi:hypothetical protein